MEDNIIFQLASVNVFSVSAQIILFFSIFVAAQKEEDDDMKELAEWAS